MAATLAELRTETRSRLGEARRCPHGPRHTKTGASTTTDRVQSRRDRVHCAAHGAPLSRLARSTICGLATSERGMMLRSRKKARHRDGGSRKNQSFVVVPRWYVPCSQCQLLVVLLGVVEIQVRSLCASRCATASCTLRAIPALAYSDRQQYTPHRTHPNTSPFGASGIRRASRLPASRQGTRALTKLASPTSRYSHYR